MSFCIARYLSDSCVSICAVLAVDVLKLCSMFFPGLLPVMGRHICNFACDEGNP
uniref:Uncharacterized protein n=1 Tax=Arundo donax TaxID=35708 RepID=A0A0A9H293_ARUDO